jgi:phosphoenolpyruvate synthase/pyruvate phosphate dikinase
MMVEASKLTLHSTGQFGGKASAIGEMHRCGIPVAGGLAISIEAYRQHIRLLGISPELERFWAETDSHEINRLSSLLACRLIAMPPVDLATAALELMSAIPGCNRSTLIVRSSATVEDSRDCSFAGQFLSSPCTATVHHLALAISNVWSSATQPHVRLYMRRMGGRLASRHPEMGTLIQPYIDCDLSGLLFTRHPTVPVPGWALIEFTRCTPDAIVSGKVTPSRWQVNLMDHRVIVEHESSGHDGLSKAETTTLVNYGSALMSVFGGEVDIEWGRSAQRLTLFQCRPLTTLPGS